MLIKEMTRLMFKELIACLFPEPPKLEFGSPKIIHEIQGYQKCLDDFLDNFNKRFKTNYTKQQIKEIKKEYGENRFQNKS